MCVWLNCNGVNGTPAQFSILYDPPTLYSHQIVLQENKYIVALLGLSLLLVVDSSTVNGQL